MRIMFLFLVSYLLALPLFAQDDSVKILLEKEREKLELERERLEREREQLELEKEMLERERSFRLEEREHMRDRDDRVRRYRSESFFGDLKVETYGDIKLTDDETGIKAIEDGGYFFVSKSTFGNRRSIKIKGRKDGTLIKEYKEGGTEVPFEPNGRAWLEEIMPSILQDTYIGIDDRIERRYKKGGVELVTEYIESFLESTHSKRVFYHYLLKNYKLGENDIAVIANSINNEIDSDFEKAELSIDAQDYFLKREKSAKAFFEMVSSIDSDFEKARVLKNILRNDHILQYFNYWIKTVDKIDSDFEKASVLNDILNKYKLNDEQTMAFLESTADIGSNFEKGNVIKNAVKRLYMTESIQRKLIEAASSMSSDFEARNVYVAIIEDGFESVENERLFYISVDKINSAFEKRNVLDQATEFLSDDPEAVDAFFNAVSGIHSDFEMSNVLQSLMNKNELEEEHMEGILKAVQNMNSSFEIANVMLKLAPELPRTKEWEERYKQATKSISSNHEKDRVLAAWMKY